MESALRSSMKIAAVMSVAALALAACGTSTPTTPGSSGTTSAAKVLKVGMAYDVGGRGDQSFNDAAAAGLDKAKAELKADTKEATAVNGEPESSREERLQQLIDAGYTNVVAVGFAYAPAVKKVAAANPDVKFALIDSTDATGANIENLTFAEQEGSFLVGAAAALKSKTGNIGFIGGVNVDLIKKFEAGYTMGAKTVNPAIKVQVKYLTQPPDFGGFNDPAKGKIAAAGMFQQGADVVYAAAGGSGGGVFTAAAAAGKMAIGVDSDQALTAPAAVKDVIITSMLKKVDVATFDFIKSLTEGKFTAGTKVYDLKVGGVGYSTTGGKIDDIKAKLDDFKTQIIDGKIVVPTKP
jgi:basic membrane protein A